MARVWRAVAASRAELMDAAGLGLLAAAAFTWCVTAGLVAAGAAVLGFNWRIEQGGE